MWQSIENSIRALAERAVICWSAAWVSELCCKVTVSPSPAERIRETRRDMQQFVAPIWISLSLAVSIQSLAIFLTNLLSSFVVDFFYLFIFGCEFVSLRGRQRRGVAQSCVPFWMCQLASVLCRTQPAGSAFYSKRQRERKLYSWVIRPMRAAGWWELRVFPIVLLLHFLFFFSCVTFPLFFCHCFCAQSFFLQPLSVFLLFISCSSLYRSSLH